MGRIRLAIILSLSFVNGLSAQDIGERAAPIKPRIETIVYPVQTTPAQELAKAIAQLYQNQQVVAQPQNNLLLIRVDANSKDEIIKLLRHMDPPSRTIVVHAYLLRSHGAPLTPAETESLSEPSDRVLQQIARMQDADQLSIANRIELATLENNPAVVQTAAEQPLLAGTASSARGRTNNYQFVSAGTLFTVTARTAGDAIVMEINFEQSSIDGARNDDTDVPSTVSRLTHQATIQLASGEALLTGTMVGKPDASAGHSYLVVTARVRGLTVGGTATAAATDGAEATRARVDFFRSLRGGGEAGGSFGRGGWAGGGRLSAEALDAIARGSFERADRDQNGVLSGDELNTPGTMADEADENDDGEVTLEELKKHMSQKVGARTARQSNEQPKSKPSGDRPGSGRSGLDARYLAYYTKVVAKYDVDRDGKLNADEWGKMSKDPSAADADKDGLITPQELSDFGRK